MARLTELERRKRAALLLVCGITAMQVALAFLIPGPQDSAWRQGTVTAVPLLMAVTACARWTATVSAVHGGSNSVRTAALPWLPAVLCQAAFAHEPPLPLPLILAIPHLWLADYSASGWAPFLGFTTLTIAGWYLPLRQMDLLSKRVSLKRHSPAVLGAWLVGWMATSPAAAPMLGHMTDAAGGTAPATAIAAALLSATAWSIYLYQVSRNAAGQEEETR